MLVTRGFLITVGNMIDKPPLFHAGVHCGTDLDGKISAVIFVHEIAKGNIHPAGFALILFAVIAIVDRDDPDPQKGEDDIQIVSAKSRKVFDDDTLDLTAPCSFDHRLKLRPVRVGTCQPIVDELSDLNFRKLWIMLNIF